MEIVGYVASEEDFFDAPRCIDCSIEEYCAFPNADRVLEVDRVYEKKLIDIGEGVMISEPVMVEKGLRMGEDTFFASLSHQGILAIYSCGRVQFTNLRNGKQADVEVEDWSNVAFYDNRVILLTRGKPLREATVDDVFNEQDVSVFKRIGDVDDVYHSTDTSLLHSRRVLCYASMKDILYEFNVDTRVNKRMEIEQEVRAISSLMGIDCGVGFRADPSPAPGPLPPWGGPGVEALGPIGNKCPFCFTRFVYCGDDITHGS